MFLWLISKEFFVDSFNSGFGDPFTFFSTWVVVGFRFVCVGFLHGVCCTILCRHSHRTYLLVRRVFPSWFAFPHDFFDFWSLAYRAPHMQAPIWMGQFEKRMPAVIEIKKNRINHPCTQADTRGAGTTTNATIVTKKKTTTLQKHQPLKYFYEEFQQQTRQRKIKFHIIYDKN